MWRAFGLGVFYRFGLKPSGYTASAQRELGYWAMLSLAALLGAFWFGTLNLFISPASPALGAARSALFGGIAGVELWKAFKRRGGSTGVVYVVPLSVGMILGRIGCQFAGLADMTYGAPTSLPWGWDLLCIARHPSPLYELLAMSVFLGGFFAWFRRAPQSVAAVGFYVFVAWYAAQRFLIEFTKPYGDLFLGLDLFQIGALPLFGYALYMMMRRRGNHAAARA